MNSTTTVNLPDDWQQLVSESRRARENAYAPYSKFHVGAAVRTGQGQVFSGCNVENASYGLTVCAERGTVCTAVAAGQKDIRVLSLSMTGSVVPCGACRQFLWEFNPNLLIILDDMDQPDTQPPGCIALADLLPHAFTFKR
jgi:cytidine deaminase